MRRPCTEPNCDGEQYMGLAQWLPCDGPCSRPGKASPAAGLDLSTHEGRLYALKTTACSWLVEWSTGVDVRMCSDGKGGVAWCPKSLGVDPLTVAYVYVDALKLTILERLVKVLDANYHPEVP